MLQEDSNGESSFEFVEKKSQLNNNTEGTGSAGTLSSVSSSYSFPQPSLVSIPSGNLLSNVPPPTSIPDFTLWSSTSSAEAVSNVPPAHTETVFKQPQPATSNINSLPLSDQFPSTQFSAAIPPSKGIQHGPILQLSKESEHPVSAGFIGLFKETFLSGGVLSKMAEKAKSSVDSIITTLDPQMSEYIYSGGDTEITVASEDEAEVVAVRDAFHCVFGKAWVNGIKLNLSTEKSQAVGYDAGVKNAEEKIAYSLKYRNTPTIAIENVLLQQSNNWYDLSILLLRDTEKQITVQTFSQATPVPVDRFLEEFDIERPDCKALSTEEKLATYLQTKPNWQSAVSGLTRKEVLLLTAKTLVKIYKDKLSSIK